MFPRYTVDDILYRLPIIEGNGIMSAYLVSSNVGFRYRGLSDPDTENLASQHIKIFAHGDPS